MQKRTESTVSISISVTPAGTGFAYHQGRHKKRIVDDVVIKLSEDDEAAIADEFVMTADDATTNLAEMLNMADDAE